MLQHLVINGPSVNLCHAADCIRDRQQSRAKCLLCNGLLSKAAGRVMPRRLALSMAGGLRLALGLVKIASAAAFAQIPPLRGYLSAHDPSTIIPCKNRYY